MKHGKFAIVFFGGFINSSGLQILKKSTADHVGAFWNRGNPLTSWPNRWRYPPRWRAKGFETSEPSWEPFMFWLVVNINIQLISTTFTRIASDPFLVEVASGCNRRFLLRSKKSSMGPLLCFGVAVWLKNLNQTLNLNLTSLVIDSQLGSTNYVMFYFFQSYASIWVFPKINRGGPPKWMVKIMENPMNKWMIWGVPI